MTDKSHTKASSLVPDGVTDTCQDAPSKYRRVLQGFHFQRQHLPRPRALSEWIYPGYGPSSEGNQLAGGTALSRPTLRRN